MLFLKKLAAILFLSLFCSPLLFSQVRFGLQGGVGLSNLLYHDPHPYDTDPNDLTPVFQGGGMLEIGPSEGVAFTTGLLLVGKGAQYKDETDYYDAKFILRPYYLELPARIILHGRGIYGAVGPYLAYGVLGNFKTKTDPKGTEGRKSTYSTPIRFGNSDDDDLNPFGFGVTAVFGFETRSGFRILLQAEHCFTDMVPKDKRDYPDVEKIVPYTFGLSMMYMVN
ncbi:MAG: PorT family protein [Bacteroidetes bacterium]|nr:MAG: PorT family protein [Bacteroidota bacterium]